MNTEKEAKLKKSLRELSEKIANRESYLSAVQKDVAKFDIEKADLNKAIGKRNAEVTNLIASLDKKRSDYEGWEKNKKAEIGNLQSDASDKNRIATDILRCAKADVAKLNNSKIGFEAQISDLRAELENLDVQVKEAAKRSMEVERRERAVKQREDQFDADDATLQKQQQAHYDRVRALDVDKAAFHAFVIATNKKEDDLNFEKGRVFEIEKKLNEEKTVLDSKKESVRNDEHAIALREANADEKLALAIKKEKKNKEDRFQIEYIEARVNDLVEKNRMQEEMKEWKK